MIVKMCERVRGGLEGVGCAPCEGKNRGGTVHAHARGRDTRMETCIHTYVHARGDTEEHARAHIHAHIHTHTRVCACRVCEEVEERRSNDSRTTRSHVN